MDGSAKAGQEWPRWAGMEAETSDVASKSDEKQISKVKPMTSIWKS